MSGLRQALTDQSDLVLVLAVVGILLVLFMPIPPQLLDLLLIINFSFALLILLLTFYVGKPLQFSTFPSLLLIVTLFRLALNISATRLILSDAEAGRVISAVGNYVVAGNYVIGLIVFIVLIVVQYVVVTNGAQRVAEVAARFTLDSLPGKQMSIDADMNIGLIDEKEARERRRALERESSFYGAMDGASKFVKGDAIAGIIIVLIDIIGGLAIGVAQRGMKWGEALQTFTLLTIGDGIVTQIPALIISTGTGIIVTRAASDQFLSREITHQITSYPKTLVLIALSLLGMLLLPGIPALPVLMVLLLAAGLAFSAYRSRRAGHAQEAEATEQRDGEEDIYGLLAVEPIEIAVGKALVPLVGGDDSLLMDRIVVFRKQYALEVGFVIPKVRVKDNKKLAPNGYEIRIFGAKIGEGELFADQILAIDPGGVKEQIEGRRTKDPTYGLPAVWIAEVQREQARAAGYTLVEPLTVFTTHLSEVLRQQSPNLLTRAETERLIQRIKGSQPGLVEELIPAVLTLSDVQKILQNLLQERVPIRNLELILEILADYGKQSKDAGFLTELVRQKLGTVICQALASPQGDLYVLTLDPAIEQAISSGMRTEDGKKGGLVLEPRLAEQVVARLAAQVEKMMASNLMPVLLCAPEMRQQIRRFTERVLPHLSVLSFAEVPTTVNLKSFGMVGT